MSMYDAGHDRPDPLIGLFTFSKEDGASYNCTPESYSQLCDGENNIKCAIKVHKVYNSFNFWTRAASACDCFKRTEIEEE